MSNGDRISTRTMTKREMGARAQSLGVSMETFASMTDVERRRGATAVGAYLYGDRGIATTTGEGAGDGGAGERDPTGAGGGGYTLTFAQTEAGVRLAAALGHDVNRAAGLERDKLQNIMHSLAMELLPPKDVETAMRTVRSGRLVKSKLAFNAVLENLADEAAHAERRRDIALAEENERRTLRDARARITVDLVGRDLGRAILFALGAGD